MMGANGDSLFSIYQSNVLIDGFTIKNGSGTNPLQFSSYRWGGGVLIDVGNEVEIKNCKIINNSAEYGGGVAIMSHAYGQFENCIISNNNCSEGAGMRVRTQSNFKSSSLTNCLISDNAGGYYGVGIYLGGATMNINYSTIYNNGAGSIRGNGCPNNIYNISNSIINSVNYNGFGCAQFNVNNTYSNGYFSGVGNISSNLNFVDAANQDYRLSDSSICIGAGINDSITIDLDGNNRPLPIGSNTDIGAYESILGYPFLPGCTDSLASNYNPNSIIDDGSCLYSIYGCMDSLACNYDSLATVDYGSCLNIYGCTDSTALNYDSLATCENSSCLYNVNGCTDSLANNYNPFATVDDSTCLYSPFIFGCTDSTALNFDPLATVDDSSCCYSSGQLWSQIGQDIDGLTQDDELGYSISLNSVGNILAVGAPHDNTYPSNTYLNSQTNGAGAVRVYEKINGTWYQLGQTIYAEAQSDYFGGALSLSSDGSILAIGAKFNDDSGIDAGHVRIFENIGGTWIQIGQDIDGEAANDESGTSVSLSSDGSIVAIGAPTNDGNGFMSGHVRIFENIFGVWIQIGQDINGEAIDDFFGYKVSLSSNGNIVAIGGPNNDGNGSYSGHVRIYENNGGTWIQVGQDIDGATAGELSGCAIDLNNSGNIIAIGAKSNSTSGTRCGQVRIFENISGVWTIIGQALNGESSYDESGYSVSLSSNGNIVSIGAIFNNGNGSNSGHVRTYENTGGSWSQIGQDIDGEADYDASGSSISLSSDGSIVAIGATGNGGNGYSSGHVRIYSLDSSNITACTDLGCLDPLALNFDPYATVDDSSCVYPNYGCLDLLALNYNSSANIDDGSCNYCTNDTSFTNITACDSVEWNGEWYDSSGTYYSNTVSNNNYSLSFDGYIGTGNDNVSINGLSSPSNIRTYEFYIYAEPHNPHINQQGSIFHSPHYSSNTNWGEIINFDGDNDFNIRVGFDANPSSYCYWDGDGEYDYNQWHHVVVEFNSNGQITLYVNGVLNNFVGGVQNCSSSYQLWDDIKLGEFNGNLSHFSVFDYSLNLQQINGFMQCPPIGNESGLVGYWNFEEGSGNTVYDLTSNGNDGTINGALYDTNVPIQSCQLTNINGCDSVAVLNLTINNSSTSTFTVTSCDSYDWDGVTYTATGQYSNTYTGVNSCDSTVTLDLTINNSSSLTVTITACDDFNWDGTTYDSTGFYTNVYTDLNGCDSTVTLDLTINNSSSLTVTITACDSYDLDGVTYTTSGQYTNLYTGTNGCDSSVTLNLTINNSSSSTVIMTSCDSYDWDGVTYTSSGLYTNIYTGVNGCDSSVTLDLTISNSSTNTVSVTACDSYDWDGVTYTTSGQYTNTYTGSNTCDSTVTLDLTINNSTTSSLTISSCDSYDWNGVTYTSTGLYTNLFSGSNGCDSTVTLDLTINNSSSTIFSDSTCDVYVWDGVSYDSTGLYTNIYTGTNGCDSSVTLDLLVLLCYGCTDSTALNYNPQATIDDSTCIYPIYGCTNPFALNFDSLATIDDGSCIIPIYGCTDPNALNYYAGANFDDGSCIYIGCTDTLACNYDTLATIDDGSCLNNFGCTDSLALNYNPQANCDDSSCSYLPNCFSPQPTGLYSFDLIDTRAKIGWDNMNDSACMVWKYFVRYREVGTNSWTTKSAGVGNGLCNFGLNTVTKQLLNLTPSTTYEFRMKAFYCGGTSSNYSTPVQFTTADPCPDMTNLTTTTFNSNQSKVRFNWDTTGTYTFARILLRVDVPGSNWQTAGGFGVYYPTFFVNKFGLTAGENYRAQGRTFCDSNITAYRSPTWTAPIFWTQPGSIKLEGGTVINNLDVYPNPSRDVFNISFTSDKIQDLGIRIINTVGSEVYREERKEFIGEYTKQISLDNYGKGIYFLEIETSTGVVNKKLILQ
ncbi:T9SS type A sorting domain-containing protein [bacterium]|nr:T9SS type A sorting domain-containing protein [bacterium]